MINSCVCDEHKSALWLRTRMQLSPSLPRCFSNWSTYLDRPLIWTFSFNLYASWGFNLFRVYNLNSWDVFAQSRRETTISLRNKSWGPLYCKLEYLQVFEINTQSEHGNEGHPQAQGPCSIITSLSYLVQRMVEP